MSIKVTDRNGNTIMAAGLRTGGPTNSTNRVTMEQVETAIQSALANSGFSEITCGTENLEAGISPLPPGALYLVYEVSK